MHRSLGDTKPVDRTEVPVQRWTHASRILQGTVDTLSPYSTLSNARVRRTQRADVMETRRRFTSQAAIYTVLHVAGQRRCSSQVLVTPWHQCSKQLKDASLPAIYWTLLETWQIAPFCFGRYGLYIILTYLDFADMSFCRKRYNRSVRWCIKHMTDVFSTKIVINASNILGYGRLPKLAVRA